MPNIVGCVKRLVGKKSTEKEEQEEKKEQQESSSSSSSTPSSSSSYPYCESFDHLVSRDTDYTYLQSIAEQDLQRHREEFDKSGKSIERLLEQLADPSLEPKRRVWLQDDLHAELRKNESSLSRVRLAEKQFNAEDVAPHRLEPSVRELEARREHYALKLKETEEALRRRQ